MIQLKTILNVIDNSGAILAECIRVAHGGRYGRIVIKKARPISPITEKPSSGSAANPATKLLIRKGEVKKALIVRTRKETRRPDGRYIKFDDNACILLNNRLEPLATRVLGVVGNELRNATKLPEWRPIKCLYNAESLINEYKIKANKAVQCQAERKAREGESQQIVNAIHKNDVHSNSQKLSTEFVIGTIYKSDSEMADVEYVFDQRDQRDKLLIGIGECLSNVKIKYVLKNDCVSKNHLRNSILVKHDDTPLINRKYREENSKKLKPIELTESTQKELDIKKIDSYYLFNSHSLSHHLLSQTFQYKHGIISCFLVFPNSQRTCITLKISPHPKEKFIIIPKTINNVKPFSLHSYYRPLPCQTVKDEIAYLIKMVICANKYNELPEMCKTQPYIGIYGNKKIFEVQEMTTAVKALGGIHDKRFESNNIDYVLSSIHLKSLYNLGRFDYFDGNEFPISQDDVSVHSLYNIMLRMHKIYTRYFRHFVIVQDESEVNESNIQIP
ncbi:30159_t:CDS:2, partial [Gigaspora margarita]